MLLRSCVYVDFNVGSFIFLSLHHRSEKKNHETLCKGKHIFRQTNLFHCFKLSNYRALKSFDRKKHNYPNNYQTFWRKVKLLELSRGIWFEDFSFVDLKIISTAQLHQYEEENLQSSSWAMRSLSEVIVIPLHENFVPRFNSSGIFCEKIIKIYLLKLLFKPPPKYFSPICENLYLAIPRVKLWNNKRNN